MQQHPNLKLLPEKDISTLEIEAIESNATVSELRAAAIYQVPGETLRDRRDLYYDRLKLKNHEEERL